MSTRDVAAQNQLPAHQPSTEYIRVSVARLDQLEATERKLQELQVQHHALQVEFENYKLLHEYITNDAAPYSNSAQAPSSPPPKSDAPAPLPAQNGEAASLPAGNDGASSPSAPVDDGASLPPGDGATVPTAQVLEHLLFGVANDAAFLTAPKELDTTTRNGHKPIITSPIQYGEIFALVDQITSQNATSGTYQKSYLLTPDRVQSLCVAIELGTSRRAAAAAVGIARRTIEDYSRYARQGKEPYVTLIQLFEIAEARTEIALVGSWRRQAQDSWQAAAALLAKRFKQDWGDRQTLVIEPAQLQQMSAEELREVAGELAPPKVIDADDSEPAELDLAELEHEARTYQEEA